MSLEAMVDVFARSEAEGTDRLVMLVLANSANEETGQVWLSVERIAERARLSKRATQYALRRLLESGELVKVGEHPKWRTNVYVLRPGKGGADSAPMQPGASEGAAGCTQSQEEPKTVSPPRRSPSRILSLKEEHGEFGQWIGHHCIAAQQSVPKPETSYRSQLARTFAALREEGWSLEELLLASDAVLADEFMRSNGHTAPENVLRKTKVGKWVEAGRQARAARESRGEGGESRAAKFERLNAEAQARQAEAAA